MRLAALLALVPALAAWAQPADDAWLGSAPAQEFRMRVVQLALIYGDSSGIDPQGFKVVTRAANPVAAGGCADVEVATLQGDRVVRRETVHACRQH